MKKKVFTETAHCRNETHCSTCRDRVGGRKWRREIMEVFDVPGNHVDFACPLGRKWGRQWGDWFAKLFKSWGFKSCKGCKKRQSWLNRRFSLLGKR